MRYKKTEWKFKSHHIQKRFFMQFSTNGCDVSAGKNNRKCHSIHLCRYGLRFVTKTSMRQPVAKVLETLPYFGSNGLSMIFCLWSPLHRLLKFLELQDHAQNWEKNNFEWKGREGGQYYISQTCD